MVFSVKLSKAQLEALRQTEVALAYLGTHTPMKVSDELEHATICSDSLTRSVTGDRRMYELQGSVHAGSELKKLKAMLEMELDSNSKWFPCIVHILVGDEFHFKFLYNSRGISKISREQPDRFPE